MNLCVSCSFLLCPCSTLSHAHGVMWILSALRCGWSWRKRWRFSGSDNMQPLGMLSGLSFFHKETVVIRSVCSSCKGAFGLGLSQVVGSCFALPRSWSQRDIVAQTCFNCFWWTVFWNTYGRGPSAIYCAWILLALTGICLVCRSLKIIVWQINLLCSSSRSNLWDAARKTLSRDLLTRKCRGLSMSGCSWKMRRTLQLPVVRRHKIKKDI